MIVADGLSKLYGEHAAVDGVRFEIGEGEIVGLLGLNGAGKTTVLQILSCLLLPSAGCARIAGYDVVAESLEARRRTGFLAERPPLYDEMRVEDFLRLVAELQGLSQEAAKGAVGQTLERLDLVGVRRQVIGTLSYGFRQRVGIGQAIVHDPEVVILDEPITGLDPVQIVEMRDTIAGLRGRHTVLLSSHILHEISQTCDRILVIERGRIVAEGREEELANRSGGGFEVTLTVRGDGPELRALLEGLDVVRAIGALRSREGLHQAALTLDGDAREIVSRAVFEAGFGLLELAHAEDELESIFLRLTRTRGEPA